ncbi:cell wall-binding repeat-containing protein [Quadrisphaera sp. KR29]|uniref:cell wall-binding repeat-containing protein n=1 Tax=Quadrisphaera sp. KR29 TaxID=3461391 RepID=UPI0040440AC3
MPFPRRSRSAAVGGVLCAALLAVTSASTATASTSQRPEDDFFLVLHVVSGSFYDGDTGRVRLDPDVEYAVVASGGDRYLADSLAAAPLAEALDAPVLLAGEGPGGATHPGYYQSSRLRFDKREVRYVVVGRAAHDDALVQALDGELRARTGTQHTVVGLVKGHHRWATADALAELSERVRQAKGR